MRSGKLAELSNTTQTRKSHLKSWRNCMGKQKLLKKGLVIALVLQQSASCVSTQYESPAGELCNIEQTGPAQYYFACSDERLEEPTYNREPILGDFCTNPSDYFAQKNHILDLAEKLTVCEALSKKNYQRWLKSKNK